MDRSKQSTDPVYKALNREDAVTFDEIGQMIWTTPSKKCECGAKYTSRPNYHLDWCPLYEKK